MANLTPRLQTPSGEKIILESKPLDLEVLESKPSDLEVLESKPSDLEVLESKPSDLEWLLFAGRGLQPHP